MSQVTLTVFIADDETAICNGLMEAIPWDLYDARVIGTAQDGISALACIKKFQPDLVIIDIKMPGLDGLDVIREAKKTDIRSHFLILSGYNDFALAQKAIRYGANGYFLKPLKIEEFKDELSWQFSEIIAKKHTIAANANQEMLMRTSRIFFLNQLIQNELRDPEEFQRRYSILNLAIQDQLSCVLVCTSTPGKNTLPPFVEAAFSEALSGFSCELWSGKLLLAIVNLDAALHTQAVLNAKLIQVIQSLNRQTGQRFIAAVGQKVAGLESSSVSYNSALQALSYHIYEMEGDVYDSSIICRQEPAFSPEKISFDALIASMESNHIAAITRYCDDFLNSLFYVPMPPPDFVRGMCIYLANNSRMLFFAKHPEFPPESPITADEINSIHSVRELRSWLIRTITSYSSQYRAKKEAADVIIETARQFIQENLSRNIKARDVAARVNLSESYFTVYFKNKTGQNFRDYILKVRIDQARQLLSERKMNINEIAHATGYQDYRSFSRAFKKITGLSPSDYQNL